MADRLRLGQARQADRALAAQIAEARGEFRHGREIDAGAALDALLEDQRLFELQAAIAGVGFRHRRIAGGLRTRGAALRLVHHSTSASARA